MIMFELLDDLMGLFEEELNGLVCGVNLVLMFLSKCFCFLVWELWSDKFVMLFFEGICKVEVIFVLEYFLVGYDGWNLLWMEFEFILSILLVFFLKLFCGLDIFFESIVLVIVCGIVVKLLFVIVLFGEVKVGNVVENDVIWLSDGVVDDFKLIWVGDKMNDFVLICLVILFIFFLLMDFEWKVCFWRFFLLVLMFLVL